MVNRDYAKEVGLESGEKTISKPVAAAVLVVLAVAGFFAVKTWGFSSTHGSGTSAAETAKSSVAVH